MVMGRAGQRKSAGLGLLSELWTEQDKKDLATMKRNWNGKTTIKDPKTGKMITVERVVLKKWHDAFTTPDGKKHPAGWEYSTRLKPSPAYDLSLKNNYKLAGLGLLSELEGR